MARGNILFKEADKTIKVPLKDVLRVCDVFIALQLIWILDKFIFVFLYFNKHHFYRVFSGHIHITRVLVVWSIKSILLFWNLVGSKISQTPFNQGLDELTFKYSWNLKPQNSDLQGSLVSIEGKSSGDNKEILTCNSWRCLLVWRRSVGLPWVTVLLGRLHTWPIHSYHLQYLK